MCEICFRSEEVNVSKSVTNGTLFQVLGSCSQPLSLQDTQLIKVPQSDFSCAEDTAAGTSPWVYAGLAPAILLFFVVAGFLLHRFELSRGICEISQFPDKALSPY